MPRNVLFFIFDDLSTLALREGPFRARTPHLDALISRGANFLNAHCTSPLCGPARAALWTGVSPLQSGLNGFDQQRNDWRQNAVLKGAPTLMERFFEAGFDVAGTGKIFHNGHERFDVWRRHDGKAAFGVPSGFGPMPHDGKTARWLPHPELAPPMNQFSPQAWDNSFAPLSRVPHWPAQPEENIPGYRGWWDERLQKPFRWQSPTDRDALFDEQNAAWASEFLRSRGENRRPFFLGVGLNRPHCPLYAPDEFFDLYPPEKIPDLPENSLENLPEALWKGEHGASGRRRLNQLLETGGPALYKEWIRSYLACASFADAQVGAVLRALRESGLEDETLVVVTSDHGYHLGDKGVLFKNTLWESASRVPMIWAGAGVEAGARQTVVSHLDVLPTLLNWCKVPQKNSLAGRDLGAILQRHDALDASGEALVVVGADADKAPRRQFWALRRENWRYLQCPDGSEALYDIENDPHETRNLAREANFSAIARSLRVRLNDHWTT